MPFPEEFLNEPTLAPENQIFIEGFHVLSHSRPLYSPTLGYTGSLGFIPLTEIESYCRIFQIEDVETFVLVIRHMDRIYVEFHNEKLTIKPPAK